MRLMSFTTSITRLYNFCDRNALGALLRHHQGSTLHVCAAQQSAAFGANGAAANRRRARANAGADTRVYRGRDLGKSAGHEMSRRSIWRSFQEPASKVTRRCSANWERLFAIRDDVLRALEEARVAKQIGSSLEAKVTIRSVGKHARVVAAASKRFALFVYRLAG